jgi:translation initiation factor 5B
LIKIHSFEFFLLILERDPQWAVILAFDVRVEREAQDLAEHLGVQIFTADIIYHLFDRFIGYQQELKRKKREEFKDIAVFPCKLKIMPEFIFNKRDPIVVGVRVESGFVKMGTPIIAYCEDSEEREFKDVRINFFF